MKLVKKMSLSEPLVNISGTSLIKVYIEKDNTYQILLLKSVVLVSTQTLHCTRFTLLLGYIGLV